MGTGPSAPAARRSTLSVCTSLRQSRPPHRFPGRQLHPPGKKKKEQQSPMVVWANSEHTSRFLQLVESRLSQLESDVRSLKDQNRQLLSQGGSVQNEPIMAGRRASLISGRRDSLSTYQMSVSVTGPDSDDYGASPDATDGIGSIEFTKEDDSGYYGMQIMAIVRQPPKHTDFCEC